MSLLKRLFGTKEKSASAPSPFDAPITPDTAFFAVGDVHGCFTLMQALLGQITAHDVNAPIVFVGDYVDRSEQSADVLRALFARRADPTLICLRGNHEEMMLDFLQDPESRGERWLSYGGLQTLASFGVGGISPNSKGAALVQACDDLRMAMGAELIDWLTDLPGMWQSGNVAVVHAAADPHLPMTLQGTETLAWGHRDFATTPRQDGVWVVHGHTIVDDAHAQAGRIAVDTGAYATGRLTAAYITAGADPQFLQT